MEEVLITPRKGKNEFPVGPVVAMVAIERDAALVRQAAGMDEAARTRILASPVFEKTAKDERFALVGSLVGAPYAVLVLEKLVALGARQVVFWGWCGSIQDEIKTGDLIIPTGATVGEGTSPYYGDDDQPVPSTAISEVIVRACEHTGRPFHRGVVWSTDAPYRETKTRVLSLQNAGILGVDMEVSALFTVARYRGINLGAILVVSDELASLTWKPGFSSPAFHETRKVAAEIVTEACRDLYGRESR